MQRIYYSVLIGAPFVLVPLILLWVFGFFDSPPTIPIFPGAQQVIYDQKDNKGDLFRLRVHIQYTTDAEPSTVENFYTSSITQGGWHHFTDPCGTDEYHSTKGVHPFQLYFEISPAPEANRTMVDVYLDGSFWRTSCDQL